MCPGKRRKVVRCVTGAMGCPTCTETGKTSKAMLIRFIVGGGNGASRFRIIQKISPLLSRRTLQMMGKVPKG